tara:strand:+ start:8210 stop:8437 length:228 start_codon:yes stop_codon:yes gene_type:complete
MSWWNTEKHTFGVSECLIYKILIVIVMLLLVETILIFYTMRHLSPEELKGVIRETQKEVLVDYFSEYVPVIYAEN